MAEPQAQIALAWVLRQPGVIAIPKASNEKHVRDNARSIDMKLTKEDLSDLDQEFPCSQIQKTAANAVTGASLRRDRQLE